MRVTVEQWGQAEADRQRQSDMVQTLINEVRRLGTVQSNHLQEIQKMKPEQFLPTPPATGCSWTTTTGDSCRRRNHRHENWETAHVFKLREHVR